MIVLDKVTKKYDGKCVLKDLSLSLPETGIVRIMGKSGEGKTTLLHIIAGLVKPDSGTVRVEGSLSMVFQEDRLLKWDSVLENVRLAAGKRRSAESILTELGLGGELKTKAKDLSGGMARRTAIARCLAHKADIYIMDEPLKGLDKDTAAQAEETVRKYTEGSLLLVVTHSPEEFADADMTVSI